MINLYWFSYLDATCPYFNVYRSITGIAIPFPNGLTIADQLIFSATSTTKQTISFTAVDIDSVVHAINAQGKGVAASKSHDGTKVFIRCTARKKAKLKLFNSSFLAHTGLTPQIIVPALQWVNVGNVARLDHTYNYTYADPDGDPLDWYHITSMGAPESIPSVALQPFIPLELMTVVEGRLTDAQNNPAEYAEIRAKLEMIEETGEHQAMVKPVIETKTDKYGRFSLPLVRCKTYLLQIPSLTYSETITLPDKDAVNLLDLVPTLRDQFAPFGDTAGGVDVL